MTSPSEKTEKSPVTCNGVSPKADVYIGNKTVITVKGKDINNNGNDSLFKVFSLFIIILIQSIKSKFIALSTVIHFLFKKSINIPINEITKPMAKIKLNTDGIVLLNSSRKNHSYKCDNLNYDSNLCLLTFVNLHVSPSLFY
ncbi:hypothetical protein DESME_13355 [Desulfitobacterium metallireducens DSM 15288]|uniref:Uncharacterized protein n=1 Tax=Desulfitobacterium metallireducens DSM 15288 TaxID=871968 RepID=W0ED54_9FIRM|nr:hypothetical protein DESME_13355 [Desulfitobacterium metallireducens DSM 15288]